MTRRSITALLAGALGIVVVVACGDDAIEPPPSSLPEAGPNDATTDTDAPPTRAPFGLDTRPANPTCKAPARPPSGATVRFVPAFQTVNLGGDVMSMEQPPGDKTRWFVAQRGGKIVRFDVAAIPGDAGPVLQPTEVADVGALAGVGVQAAVEAGLLGMAFHPKFATNGRLYISWVTLDGNSTIAYLTSTNGGQSFTQYTKVLEFNRFAFNHCGGTVAFGPDGYLYASFGDGGAQDNVYRFGQSLTGFQSKLLRIDVDTPPPVGQTYVIPPDNPFVGVAGAEPAMYAYGFRNPFRFTIDRVTGDIWVGDVGEDSYEEVNRIVPGGNYGWSCREGSHDHHVGDPDRCPSRVGLIDPVFELKQPTPSTRAIIGGHIYRGAAIPGLVGSYVFADYVTSELYTLSFDPVTGTPKPTIVNPDGPADFFQGFAQDLDGEIYVYGNAVYKMVANGTPPPGPAFPDRLSKTGCVDATDPKKPASGLVPYTVSSPLWSDGADKERFVALPDGAKMTIKPDGDFDLPNGSVLVKTFSLGGKRIETRLFVRHDDGDWSGYSYEWDDAQTDATLLPAGKTKKVGAQSYAFPSRSDCLRCHNEASGRTLGLELGQLDGDFLYASTNRIANQLATLEHIGMFDGAVPTTRVAYPDPQGTAPLEARARSYLHSNCSNCHRPNGLGGGDMDLRYATALKDTKTCNVAPATGDLGIAGAKLLVPGAPEKSILSRRASWMRKARRCWMTGSEASPRARRCRFIARIPTASEESVLWFWQSRGRRPRGRMC